MRRGELLAIRPESIFEYGIEVRHSISPTSDNTSLQNYYLELMPEKKHQQDADALNLLSAL